jgi:hypothetical protein
MDIPGTTTLVGTRTQYSIGPIYLGTLMVVPDSSSRASAVVSIRNPERLALADRTFFPPGCCAVLRGC